MHLFAEISRGRPSAGSHPCGQNSLAGNSTTINATGRITVDGATMSSDTIKLSTSRSTDDVCVANASLVRAVSGRINTYGVRGTPHRGETSTVTGPVAGKPFVLGACP